MNTIRVVLCIAVSACCLLIAPERAWAQTTAIRPISPSVPRTKVKPKKVTPKKTPAPAVPVETKAATGAIAPAETTPAPKPVPSVKTPVPAAATPAVKVEPGTEVVPPPEVIAPPPAREIPRTRPRQEGTRFRVGTRSTMFTFLQDTGDLTETDENGSIISGNKFSYDMSINHLEAVQQYLPVCLYVDCFFAPRFGLEVMWDGIEAEARTEEGGDNYSDGNFIMHGPLFTVIGELPVAIGSVPCRLSCGIGMAYLLGDFEEADWWQNRTGANQSMEIKDTTGFLVTAGCRGYFNDRWSMDFYLRYLQADAEDAFTITYEDSDRKSQVRTGVFPMDHVAFGIGVGYDL